MEKKKYKILQVCVDLDGGGIDRYLYNYCMRIKDIHFDFIVVDRGVIGMLEQDFLSIGSKIFRVPRQNGHIKENFSKMKHIMMTGKYDAVHVHLGYMGFLALYCAKKCGIKTRIVHSHIAYEPETTKTYVKRKIFTILTKLYATNLAACGIDAGIWQWGERSYENKKVKVINNAIETANYAFNETIRNKVRNEMNISDSTVVMGNVGRIGPQKNQVRLLEIFAEYKKRNVNSVLWLVGNREYSESEWSEKCRSLGITESVMMMGVRKDVPDLLQAMDVFVFPSVYEGLPFTLVETQCNGLPSLSSKAVTKYLKLTDILKYEDLNSSNSEWCNTIENMLESGRDANAYKKVANAGYDIDRQAKELYKYYNYCILKNGTTYKE